MTQWFVGEIPETNDDIYGSIGHNDDVDKLYNLSDGEIQVCGSLSITFL